MNLASLSINGIRVAVERGAAPARKWCKFCTRQVLAVRSCNHVDHRGRTCKAGLCERHSTRLGPDLICCPAHDPDQVYLEEEA